jgi:hypothetical protein
VASFACRLALKSSDTDRAFEHAGLVGLSVHREACRHVKKLQHAGVKVYFIFGKYFSGGFGVKIFLTTGKVVCWQHAPESVTRMFFTPQGVELLHEKYE